jgi:hypothetical protein
MWGKVMQVMATSFVWVGASPVPVSQEISKGGKRRFNWLTLTTILCTVESCGSLDSSRSDELEISSTRRGMAGEYIL